MATNHTENYQLNLWEPGDNFLRAEFNENTTKLDAAIKAVAEDMAVKLSTRAQLFYTFYTGSGTHSRTHTFPFQPKVVLFSTGLDGAPLYVMLSGQTRGSFSDGHYAYSSTISWSGNSVTISADTTDSMFNTANGKFVVIAIG